MSYKSEITDREIFAEHAAPLAISAALLKVIEAQKRANAENQWLSDLYSERMRQIESGIWPRGTTEEQ